MINILLVIVFFASAALAVFSYWEHLVIRNNGGGHANKPRNFSRLDFFTKGNESGFSSAEIKLLYELAKKSSIESPAALFWSNVQMDNCIKYIVKRYRLAGTFYSQENQIFLKKLFDLRTKIEMEKPRWKKGITNTSEIDEMQKMQIIIIGESGSFFTKVLKNTEQGLIIERPDSSELPSTFSWQGVQVKIYFWRKDDAGYFFETVVVEEYVYEEILVLRLLHAKKIERTQIRKNIRIEVFKPARLYMFKEEDNFEKTPVSSCINCMIKDLSDTGCALLVGGEAKTTFKLMVQFFIDKMPVTATGEIKSIKYNKKENNSTLHVLFESISIETQNIIRCAVFNIIGEEAEEAVFDEEANLDVNEIERQTEIESAAQQAANSQPVISKVKADLDLDDMFDDLVVDFSEMPSEKDAEK